MRRRRKERRARSSVLRSLRVDRKTLIIASPMMDMCHTAFTASLVHLAAHTISNAQDGLEMTFLQYGTSILPLSRQFLAVRALECNATHILWIDSDMEFPADMALRLARHDLPIVAANCMARRPPYMLTARNGANEQVHTTPESTGVEKVERIGFGVVWMSTEVLRAIEPPWFDLEWVPEGGIFRGEDYVFCKKAKAAGFELYVDHDLSKEVKHVGLFGYSPLLKTALPQAGDSPDGAA